MKIMLILIIGIFRKCCSSWQTLSLIQIAFTLNFRMPKKTWHYYKHLKRQIYFQCFSLMKRKWKLVNEINCIRKLGLLNLILPRETFNLSYLWYSRIYKIFCFCWEFSISSTPSMSFVPTSMQLNSFKID
jgi:hypothetical protein